MMLVMARHESGSAFMAEAEGKLRDVPALLLGTRGPGAMNLVAGVHTAFQDETPMIVLLDDRPSVNLTGGAPDEPDPLNLFEPYAKRTARAEAAVAVPGMIAEA